MGFGGILKDGLIVVLFFLVMKSWIWGQGITLKIGVLTLFLFAVVVMFRLRSV
ncbi:hypothetical protein KY337_04940 [Candidatus Woesearchaeota archaeon]|nr:hypothetical protein [Candidatus Woesearchaeota archaeon]